jgi:hypothetical protein
MADTTLIGVDDACAGLETPSGRVFPVRGNVVELPTGEAREFLDSGAPNLHRHRRVRHGWSPRTEQAWERVFGTDDKER